MEALDLDIENLPYPAVNYQWKCLGCHKTFHIEGTNRFFHTNNCPIVADAEERGIELIDIECWETEVDLGGELGIGTFIVNEYELFQSYRADSPVFAAGLR